MADFFGIAIAPSGDSEMLVGAFQRDTNSAINSGAVYIFSRSAGGTDWSQSSILTPNDAAAHDHFGCALSVAGTIAVVGAEQQGLSTGAGKAYVFSKGSGTWAQSGAAITASNGADGDSFGSAVALDSSGILAVGAPLRGNQKGAVYIFTQASPGSTTFTEAAILEASDGARDDSFGASLAISGTMLMVGAITALDPTGSFRPGRVYQLDYNGAAWAETQTLTDPTGANLDYFGSSISLLVSGSDVSLAIGSQTVDDTENNLLNSGKITTYLLNGNDWTIIRKLHSPNEANFEMFGASVALYGSVETELFIGASGYGNSQGVVYHVSRPPPPPPPPPSPPPPPPPPSPPPPSPPPPPPPPPSPPPPSPPPPPPPSPPPPSPPPPPPSPPPPPPPSPPPL